MNISPEIFARSVRDYLIPNLPAAVAEQAAAFAAVDAAEGVDVPLAAPDPERYELGGVQTVLRYPTIEISVPDFGISGSAIGNADADYTLALIIRIWDQHPRYPVLYRKMNRMLAAVYSTLADPEAFADAEIVSARGALRFNPETGEQDNIISGAILALELRSATAR